jgi:hypothetical protein
VNVVSAPREIISSLGRRGSRNLATVEYLLEHGPADAVALGEALRLSTAGAHAQLRRLHRAGVLVRLPAERPHGIGHSRRPYAVDPDALAYAGRWLLALAGRAER